MDGAIGPRAVLDEPQLLCLSSQMTGEFSLFGEGNTRESRLVSALLGAADVMSLPISPALDFSDYNSIPSGNLEEKGASAPWHLP
jgi:hypothetical protein